MLFCEGCQNNVTPVFRDLQCQCPICGARISIIDDTEPSITDGSESPMFY